MRIVETKRGAYEVMNDIHGKGIAVSCTDMEDYLEFDKPMESYTDSEVIARINRLYDND